MLYTITFLFLLFRAPQLSLPVDTLRTEGVTEVESSETFLEDTEPRQYPRYPTS